MKTALVLGAGGFIGGHLVKRLKDENYWIRGADIKYHEFSDLPCDEFVLGDLREQSVAEYVFGDQIFDEVYQLAADMGGAGFVFTGDHDADIMHNSAMINLNVLSHTSKFKKIFYSSSACIYPAYNQKDSNSPKCSELSAYPADPDSEYGWEKLFSERLYLAYQRNYGMDVKIARFHNIFGPYGTYDGGREKAPAAICRKIAQASNHSAIEIWGDGEQTRSFLYIDECIEGVRRLMNSNIRSPINIGSEEMVTINELTNKIAGIAGKSLAVRHIIGPQGVRGRNSDNELLRRNLQWEPKQKLVEGLIPTYNWIKKEVTK
jgi:GDP-D-mannose 3', 5'-epimerase